MSYNPHMNYSNQVPINYYQNSENYAQEFSENDVLEENQNLYPLSTQNITDIQLENKQLRNYRPPTKLLKKNQYGISQNVPPQCCCIRNIPPPTHIGVPYPDYSNQYCEMLRCCPLSTMSQQDTSFDNSEYRDNLNNVTHHYSFRNIQNAEQNLRYSKQVHSKRSPITVPTPKYYRKPVSSSVHKRPSALCLRVASQPDPATNKKSKRHAPSESQLEIHEAMLRTIDSPNTVQKEHSSATETLHKMDSEGDATFKVSNLDDFFQQLEEMGAQGGNIIKMSKYFKPKLPPSIRAKQERNRFQQNENTNGDQNGPTNTPQYDNTEDSLDKLLQQLKKCELPSSSNEAIDNHKLDSHRCHGEGQTAGKGDNRQIEEKDDKRQQADSEQPRGKNLHKVKSFNYQDITDQITRAQEELKGYTDSARESTTSIQEITKRISSTVSSSTGRPRSSIPRPTLDDHCALELHRSKSYIVNLIDRALSKELGTVPNERTRKQFEDMNPRKAIEVVTRHSYCKPEKSLSVEITSALTDSIISTATAPTESPAEPIKTSNSKNKVCCCTTEEPTYIKQLKQLRWGHLKHIQREVRRLEDLERFLDSCSITTIPEI